MHAFFGWRSGIIGALLIPVGLLVVSAIGCTFMQAANTSQDLGQIDMGGVGPIDDLHQTFVEITTSSSLSTLRHFMGAVVLGFDQRAHNANLRQGFVVLWLQLACIAGAVAAVFFTGFFLALFLVEIASGDIASDAAGVVTVMVGVICAIIALCAYFYFGMWWFPFLYQVGILVLSWVVCGVVAVIAGSVCR